MTLEHSERSRQPHIDNTFEPGDIVECPRSSLPKQTLEVLETHCGDRGSRVRVRHPDPPGWISEFYFWDLRLKG